MNISTAGIDRAFLDVRKAYRLLHDYQRMVMDAVGYVGTQLGLTYMGGWPKFSGATPMPGRGRLDKWAWDWLNMMEYDFHFSGELNDGRTLLLSMLLISDSGFFCSKQEILERTAPADFLPCEKSETKIGFIISAGDWKPDFMVDREAMRLFIETGGNLPPEFAGQGIVAKCCDLARLMNEESTNALIEELIVVANASGIPLQRIVK